MRFDFLKFVRITNNKPNMIQLLCLSLTHSEWWGVLSLDLMKWSSTSSGSGIESTPFRAWHTTILNINIHLLIQTKWKNSVKNYKSNVRRNMKRYLDDISMFISNTATSQMVHDLIRDAQICRKAHGNNGKFY